MSGSGSSEGLVEQLLARVRELESMVADQQHVIAQQADRIAGLQGRLGRDSSTSSRPPSADAPWENKPAKTRSSRSRSGRKPGKQPGSPSVSRSVVEDPDETVEVARDHCARCARSLANAAETGRVRRQVVDVNAPPPPKVTEYQLVSRRRGGCGHLNEATASDVPRPVKPGSDLQYPLLLRGVAQTGTALAVVSHDQDMLIVLADRVLSMAAGRLAGPSALTADKQTQPGLAL